MHPAVFPGVTNSDDKNGGAYSNTNRLTMSRTKILKTNFQKYLAFYEVSLTLRNKQQNLEPAKLRS